jgi:DmsE family decaheme c-type cytochrome
MKNPASVPGALRALLTGLAGLVLAAAALGPAWAQAPAAAPAAMPQPGQYTAKGADTCLECHADDDGAYSGSELFKTKHALRGDKRAPFGAGGLQCEACHGPGALHARNKRASAIVGFGAGSKSTVAERNAICLTCHEGGSRTAWHAGAHDRNDVACSSCHQVHRSHGDPMLRKAAQTEQCLSCHKSQRADFHKASAHPVKQGQMACSDCHAPHGSSTPAMLAKPTLNQTCFSCHADKRGPLLWEHAPVAEDCANCHTPHGSVRSALLVKNPPQLCQSCHSSSGHPAVPRTPANLPGGSAGGAIFTVAGSCTSCHTQVHGSNHPSGAKLLR